MNTTAQQVLDVQRLEKAADWLLRLQDDTVSEDEMQQWLDWCERDLQNLEAFERIQSLWRGVPRQSAPMEIKRTRGPGTRRQWPRGWKRLAAAAGIVIALATGFFYERVTRLDSMTMARIEAPARMNQNSVLPDGSQLDLSAGSRITLDYSHRARELTMEDGMAFFRVAPNRARPFTVHAGSLDVTAVGTAFNVRRHGERVIVTVKEGVVRIDKPDGDTVRAHAGYQLLYDADLRETLLRPMEPDAELAWLDGRLVYDGEPLDTVVEIVNRYAARKIILGDPKLRRLRYTGTVFTDSIETWLDALPRAFPVRVDQSPERVMLLTR